MIKFWIPKVYSWEDAKKQILKDMEREGIPLDGIGAGSTTTEIITIMHSVEKYGVAGTSTDGLLKDDEALEEVTSADDSDFAFSGKGRQSQKITIGGSSNAYIR